MTKKLHQSVLLQEAVNYLNVETDQYYVDATFGRGGHTQEILKKGGKVIALDCDREAIEYGQKTFANEIKQGKLILIRENFDKLEQVINELKNKDQVKEIKGILFDFGTSVDQLKSEARGFSFDTPESELDMRMDDRLGVKAKDLLAVLSEKQLAELFKEYGGEYQAKAIAKAIDRTKKSGDLTKLATVGGLVDLITKVKRGHRGHLHPATKVFQALRIAVNDELSSINKAMPQTLAIIKTGRIVTIAFHEGEDRIIKNLFKDWAQTNLGTIITHKAIKPDEEELNKNPRARSAKLRAFEK